jgi:RHS repeat-associated protein
MTDADGDLVQHHGYMPFGNERFQDNTDAFSVTNRYTGQQLDEETGLYFYGSRYYDPELARFIQPDSIGQGASSQSLNRYTYCINNPLKFTDPTGHFIDPVTWIIIGAIVGAGVGGGIAAAQGGNFWKGALAGGIAGAFGGYGLVTFGADNLVGVAACAAGGGALGALVTGGDPGMAAATAAIIAAGVEAVSNLSPQPNTSGVDSILERHIKLVNASQGNPGVAGGTGSFLPLPVPVPPFIIPVHTNIDSSILSTLKQHLLKIVETAKSWSDNMISLISLQINHERVNIIAEAYKEYEEHGYSWIIGSGSYGLPNWDCDAVADALIQTLDSKKYAYWDFTILFSAKGKGWFSSTNNPVLAYGSEAATSAGIEPEPFVIDLFKGHVPPPRGVGIMPYGDYIKNYPYDYIFKRFYRPRYDYNHYNIDSYLLPKK